MKKTAFIALIAALFTFVSCSSTKRPMVITTVTDQADSNYEEANNLISYGKYEMADEKLTTAKNLAVSIDDSYLLTRISCSRISYFLALNELEQAENAMKDAARYYSRCSKEEKKSLAGIFSVYQARIILAKNENPETALSLLTKEKNNITGKYYLAYWNRVYGEVCVALKKYKDAENAFEEAAKIHIKDRYLSEIGQDYFSLARTRSLAGKKNGAVEAMELALKYDKDAENTQAIILDYFACAKILVKDNPSEDDRKKARGCAEWAKEIAITSGNVDNLQQIEDFLKNN